MLESIDLAKLLGEQSSGVIWREQVTLPRHGSAPAAWRLRLPAWTRAVYHAPFQRHSIDPSLDLWPEGYNQCQPLPVESLRDAKRGGMFLLLETGPDDFVAILPLGGKSAMAWFRGDDRGLTLEVSHFGDIETIVGLPLLAYARASEMHEACQRVWAVALAHPAMAGCGRLRWEKKYPEPFLHLGWCSFEEFKLGIDESSMIGVLRALGQSPLPIRWALIDDGHLDDGDAAVVDTQEGAKAAADQTAGARRLRSLGTHPKRFPNGWGPLLAEMRGTPLRWLGVWLNFNGYWDGLDGEGDWPEELKARLTRIDERTVLPAEGPRAAEIFWKHMLAALSQAGIDFLKVDNQAGNLRLYAGRVHNAVRASTMSKLALEGIAESDFKGLINCMAHNTVCTINTPASVVTRCSEDYKREDRWRAKHHLHNSFGNMLWLGPTVWGDHDMFHTSDRVAGPLMARSKALSGGPVYLSDNPRDFRAELVWPLCDSTGRLYRPLAPAAPLPDSVFVDPYEADQAYRVAAPLSHGCAAVAAYNLTHPEKPVCGRLSAPDLDAARRALPSQTRDRAGAPSSVLAYDVLRRTAVELAEPLAFSLSPLEDLLFVLSPIRHGWALIGDPEKFLCPAVVERFACDETSCELTVSDAARLLLWSARDVVCESAEILPLGGGLWSVAASGGAPLRLLRARTDIQVNRDK